MKKIIKLLAIFAFIVLFGFVIITCEDPDNDKINGDSNSETPATVQTFDDISAAELVAKIKIGWNLGNTLDTHSTEAWYPSDVAGMEKAWNNPVTTKAMIDKLKSEGFNAIRIPVTWYKAAGKAPDFAIRSDWMARVVEVVNYAIDNDMYVLLNTHHDEHIFKFTNAEKTASLNAFKKIWTQIAETFKNYNEKLIFEGLNEPRTIGTNYEWSGGNAEERANLNEHYQAFVDTVRASGGNNTKRILMVNTHAASASSAAVNGLTIPTDSANTKNKIIVSIHAYSPYMFAHEYPGGQAVWSKDNPDDVFGITNAIDPVYNRFVKNGIPVIIGEFGCREEKAASSRAEWSEYYVKYARNKGIACFLWDDGGWFKLFNRSALTFYAPTVLAALMKGVNDATLPPIIEPDGSGGGGGGITGGSITIGSYTWKAYNDNEEGGMSSVSISENPSGTISISGNITKIVIDKDLSVDGFAGCEAVPNTTELANLKTATTITFKVKGDGKDYKIMLPLSTNIDNSYYFTTFTAPAEEAVITVNISDFAQPLQGAIVDMDKSLLEKILWQTNNSASGAFSLSIWDLTLNGE